MIICVSYIISYSSRQKYIKHARWQSIYCYDCLCIVPLLYCVTKTLLMLTLQCAFGLNPPRSFRSLASLGNQVICLEMPAMCDLPRDLLWKMPRTRTETTDRRCVSSNQHRIVYVQYMMLQQCEFPLQPDLNRNRPRSICTPMTFWPASRRTDECRWCDGSSVCS